MTAFVAYSLGHQSAPVSNNQPTALISAPPVSAKPVVINVPGSPGTRATPRTKLFG
jgi:hypothetical protein